TRFRAKLPEPNPGPAGRRPRAPISRRHGVRDARAKERSEHLPLEGTQGANPSGGAPDSFLPQGASPRVIVEPVPSDGPTVSGRSGLARPTPREESRLTPARSYGHWRC